MEPTKEIALILTGTLPEISGNFDACKAFYQAELKRYEALVTEETLPTAKADLAKLRAEIKRLDRVRIDEAARLKTPITAMEAKVKELTGMVEKTVEQIDKQVKAFEKKTLELCKNKMADHLGAEYVRLEVRMEYQQGLPMLDSLVGISKVTGKGELTKSGRESITGLAMQGRANQDKADGRMSRVEADCRAAGVEPLTREHVAAFIDDGDAVFSMKLKAMIDAEVKRQSDALKKKAAEMQANADRQAKIKADAEAVEAARIAKEKMAKEKAEADEKERQAREAEDERAKCEALISPATTPEPAPIAPPAEELPKTEEKQPTASPDKKVLTFQYSVTVSIHAKATADYEKVRSIVAGMVRDAVLKADARIISTDVAL